MNELSEMTEGQFLLLENAQWWHGGTLPGTRTPRTDVARAAAAEIRRLRAALAERDELLAKAGEHMRTLLKWCPAQRSEWMDQDSYQRFKELRDEAVLFATALREPQP